MLLDSQQLQIEINGNPVIVCRGRNNEFWQDYDRGNWEPDTQVVFRRFIDGQHSYIDIGAWIGPTLLLGCQLAKRTYGVEPDPIAYTELAKNVALNAQLTGKVVLFQLCISPLSGEQSFGSQTEGGGSTSSLLLRRKDLLDRDGRYIR